MTSRSKLLLNDNVASESHDVTKQGRNHQLGPNGRRGSCILPAPSIYQELQQWKHTSGNLQWSSSGWVSRNFEKLINTAIIARSWLSETVSPSIICFRNSLFTVVEIICLTHWVCDSLLVESKTALLVIYCNITVRSHLSCRVTFTRQYCKLKGRKPPLFSLVKLTKSRFIAEFYGAWWQFKSCFHEWSRHHLQAGFFLLWIHSPSQGCKHLFLGDGRRERERISRKW